MNTELKNKLIEKLLAGKDIRLSTVEDLEKMYPERDLQVGAMVTRVAPSPTGPMHIGTLYMSLISKKFAKQTDGVFFLRIEDTDKKREVQGATRLITDSLDFYNIKTDEGENKDGVEVGKYGPYKQSERMSIYMTYAQNLLEKGFAYPCFCTTSELEKVREEQEGLKIRPGYYGKWATCRNHTEQEILKKIEADEKFILRFKSSGNFDNKIIFEDLIKGRKELSENDQDIVLIKGDNLPTYHFAHLVDDHLMRTTHVLRGDEWFSSLPLHLQLFETMGWQAPQYGHIAPIQKLDGPSKRKLSKRKDPEANVNYYKEQGYHPQAVIEYLLNLANSNFEDWRKENAEKDINDFKLSFEKLAHSNGALFDFNKLNDISKNIIAKMSADAVYNAVCEWASVYNESLFKLLSKYTDYAKKIFGIEREGTENKRKDLAKWSEVKDSIDYFFDENFLLEKAQALELLKPVSLDDARAMTEIFLEKYKENMSKDEWLLIMKDIAKDFDYAESAKAFKMEPTKYKGTLGDVAKVFRILLSGRTQTPDLFEMMRVMGKDRVEKRLALI